MGEVGEIGSGIEEEQSGVTPGEGEGSMAAGPAKFVHEGESIAYTPGADVLTGAVVVQAELVGIAQGPIKAGQLGSLAVAGVFDFPKALGASSGMPAGSNAYWDAAAQNATKNAASGANKLIGKTVKTTVDADTVVRIRLLQ